MTSGGAVNISQEQLAAFFERFDAYALARSELARNEEDSPEERLIVARCADLWRELCDLRMQLPASQGDA